MGLGAIHRYIYYICDAYIAYSLYSFKYVCRSFGLEAIAAVRRENGLDEHFKMPMPCTVDAIHKACGTSAQHFEC